MQSTLIQDISYALRQLRKTPGFTLTAILTLALGIGANAAIFTLVNAVLLKNLPVADPATLVRIGDNNDCCQGFQVHDNGDYGYFSTDTYQQMKKSTPEFEDLAAIQAGFAGRPVIARRDSPQSTARSMSAEFVSGNYFQIFGLQPNAGRLLIDSDDIKGAPTAVVMSYEAWHRDFSNDPSIIGSTFWINTKPVTVVGISPQGFYGDRLSTTPPDFYLPINSMPVLASAAYVDDPNTSWLYIIGRVKPGTQFAPLQQKLSAQLKQIYLTNRHFSNDHDKPLLAKVHVVLTPAGSGIQDMQSEYASHLQLLTWISGLVLLIACANIANLLLVRGMGRRAEMSVRTALGAPRVRIIRQLLTESVVLAAIGGFAGLAIADLGTRMLLAMAFPGAQNIPIHAEPSLEVILFAFGLSLVTGILFGVAPAWIASNADPADALRATGRTTATGASLLQRSLVILQAALSLVLLVVAGLFSQSLNKLQHIDLKLNATNRYVIHINPQGAGYTYTQVAALYQTIEDRFHAIPGVVKVGISSNTPMENNNSGDDVQVQGQPDLHRDSSTVVANAEFFDSVGTRVVMGRGITAADTSTAPTVAVVNQAFVKTFFKPGENPIGHHFGLPGPMTSGEYEIVGVVEDTAYSSIYWKNHEMYFVSMMQRPGGGAIVLSTARPMDDMESSARRTLAGINPNLSVVKFQTLSQQISDRFSEERLLATLTTLFGGLALLLATLGLYGVTAYTVACRTSEIGIRMALGAGRNSVIGMVMRGAMVQTAIGLVVIGLPAAWLSVRYIQSQLYDSTGLDPAVLAIAVLTLSAAAAAAGFIPARRAATIEPCQALRTE